MLVARGCLFVAGCRGRGAVCRAMRGRSGVRGLVTAVPGSGGDGRAGVRGRAWPCRVARSRVAGAPFTVQRSCPAGRATGSWGCIARVSWRLGGSVSWFRPLRGPGSYALTHQDPETRHPHRARAGTPGWAPRGPAPVVRLHRATGRTQAPGASSRQGPGDRGPGGRRGRARGRSLGGRPLGRECSRPPATGPLRTTVEHCARNPAPMAVVLMGMNAGTASQSRMSSSGSTSSAESASARSGPAGCSEGIRPPASSSRAVVVTATAPESK